MNVYFTASVVGKKYHLVNYLKIIEHLKAKKIRVIADHIINTTESQIYFSKKTDRLKFHKKLQMWIQNCDVMIVEASFPSISVGYEISMALKLGKPVLVLYSQGAPPSLLQDLSEEKLICEKYTRASLPEIIDDFLMYAEGASDLRFTFFISPQIASHLETVSKKQKIPKSVYLRRLIEKDMMPKK